ncbi:HNH endonuclease [Companilactobacillus keshanensis]|uniref:HNH endonuclease n=1 Tax=Companilactobacillus keshanensis TaxID=2486003 RepID=A0ABW4BUG4_9LACO|nr:HNH endonuclease signature motif containing protein [Companilactobacillus keshanensis]
MEIYNEELKKDDINYFVIDSGSNVNHNDIDFKIYSWRKDLNKKIHPGDLFIYRRSGGGSEYRNQFYLFGAGKIGKTIRDDTKTSRAIIKIDKPFVFNRKLFKSDLENFNWNFKKHSGLWNNFFNMNGITQITKKDFVGLINFQDELSKKLESLSPNEEKLSAYIYQNEQSGEFFLDDEIGEMKTYEPAQKVFSDMIKANYGYQCCVTGDNTIENLVAVRVIPWSKNKNTRMDFKNGICLTAWLAEAFEQGMFTFTDTGKILISKQSDEEVFERLSKYQYKKLSMHKRYSPKIEYLKYHRDKIFQN